MYQTQYHTYIISVCRTSAPIETYMYVDLNYDCVVHAHPLRPMLILIMIVSYMRTKTVTNPAAVIQTSRV